MQVDFQTHKCEISDALKESAVNKLGKLNRFFNNIQNAEVIFEQTQKRGADRPNKVTIKVGLSGDFLTAETRTHDFRDSFNEAYKKMERQVRKHKEKVVDHSHGDRKHSKSPNEEISELESEQTGAS